MEKILERAEKPSLRRYCPAFLAGLDRRLPIFGMDGMACAMTDASPQHLRSDLQVDYLRMMIDSFKRNEMKRWRYKPAVSQTWFIRSIRVKSSGSCAGFHGPE
jgi:hypothetical protein